VFFAGTVMTDLTGATERLDKIRKRIASAAQEAGRAAEDVTLIAVSKTFDAAAIQPVIEAGQRVFGENRVQEAKGKWPAILDVHANVHIHLIGPLQSNKVKDAVALFDAIHTVDRVKIARLIAGEMAAQGRRPKLFIQVNTGNEPQKSGALPRDAEALYTRCRDAFGLTIEGLMCIPPFEEPPEPHFALLAKLAADLGLTSLSMGMSADVEAAIRAGATHVRVGSAIFGERNRGGIG
jgi:pyridoxal phosphate enzyme (YggS family)